MIRWKKNSKIFCKLSSSVSESRMKNNGRRRVYSVIVQIRHRSKWAGLILANYIYIFSFEFSLFLTFPCKICSLLSNFLYFLYEMTKMQWKKIFLQKQLYYLNKSVAYFFRISVIHGSKIKSCLWNPRYMKNQIRFHYIFVPIVSHKLKLMRLQGVSSSTDLIF